MINPPTPPLVLGVTGTKCAGKDTLFCRLHTLDSRFMRRAFADRLKQDVAPLIRQHLGYDPSNLSPEEKEVVRHTWIGWGMTCRAKDPLYWVKVVVGDIDHHWSWSDTPVIPIVTDVRFPNEAEYLREHYGRAFKLVNLTREGQPPPTTEEEKHFRQVAGMADFHLTWGNDTIKGQLAHAERLIGWLDAEMEQQIGPPELSSTA